ncbi:MAG TPA: class I SAM-dependent methyltransferase [Pseudonocardiaceae bacterium]|jgi:SAM-dependent methyltransferase|nr:class I SAM-dependent methyltransferase [Pseudonocardiaceae bacterium]
MADNWEQRADILAASAVAAEAPTEWFDQLYAAGRRGEIEMPWDRGRPNQALTEWAEGRDGTGRRALVIGCGLGQESELLARLGYEVSAFDISESAIATVRERFPDSPVHYRVADLLDPPADLLGAADLVVEAYTVQALPESIRALATTNVARLVAPGGTLLVIANAVDTATAIADGPPWPLTRANLDAFAANGLTEARIEDLVDPNVPGLRRWRAEFRRG